MMNKPKSRIEHDSQCQNCGGAIDAQFCPLCGQKNKDYSLSFKDLFSDFIEELLDFDSRVLLSLRKLFTSPGFLTSEYVRGRRVRYLPPVRIYLVASVLFFLTLSLKSIVPEIQNNSFFSELTKTGDLDEALHNYVESNPVSESEKSSLFPAGSGLVEIEPDSSNSGSTITVGDSHFDIQQGEFLSNFNDNFAKMMFLLLPVAALQLKLLYWRRKKQYIEHLIFSLHVHAFIFSLLILTVILDFKIMMWLVILSSFAYLYLAMKHYYGQSHSKTVSKMLLLLMSYGVTILLVLTLTLVATAVSQVLGS